MASHYDTLGVPRDATADDIKKAVRKLRRQHHPDRHGGDETRMRAINAAAEVLLNAEKRAAYDRQGTRHADPYQQAAMATLETVFAQAMDAGGMDVVDMVRQMLERGIKATEALRPKHQAKIDELQARFKTYRFTGADADHDVLGALITKRIEVEAQAIRSCERTLKCSYIALSFLSDFYVGCAPDRLEMQTFKFDPRSFTADFS